MVIRRLFIWILKLGVVLESGSEFGDKNFRKMRGLYMIVLWVSRMWYSLII